MKRLLLIIIGLSFAGCCPTKFCHHAVIYQDEKGQAIYCTTDPKEIDTVPAKRHFRIKAESGKLFGK